MTAIDVIGSPDSRRLDSLREDIAARLSRLLWIAHIDPEDVDVHLERRGSDLRVEVEGPAVPRTLQAALAVRVLDAVHAAQRTDGQVDVGYHVR